MNEAKMIMVGGFLGAGKTTLLWRVAKLLAGQGKHVGLITNDQAPDLVDTGLLLRQGVPVQEVAGSCFCCNFEGLIGAADRLREGSKADYLIAEPVGSCADLSATLLQPIKDKYRSDMTLAPLSVLIDPFRLREVLSGKPSMNGLHESAAYIVRKQMEEADVIVLNKRDLLSEMDEKVMYGLIEAYYPDVQVFSISALTGEGVDEWLEMVMNADESGLRVVDVDYDRYAEGEAVLGWLNAAISLSGDRGVVDWQGFTGELMEGLREAFARNDSEVGHVKVLIGNQNQEIVANLTRTGGEVTMRGKATGDAAEMILNARVEMRPSELEEIVRDVLEEVCLERRVDVEIGQLQSLSPGRPEPTHRYDSVIDTAAK
ncbi:cobalamin synthesis protein P47K [Planctomycetota bacterium]|nr:cobalamin synthesis protein P47K [Planctomycetota bacterium]